MNGIFTAVGLWPTAVFCVSDSCFAFEQEMAELGYEMDDFCSRSFKRS
jgi:hypothetical protein